MARKNPRIEVENLKHDDSTRVNIPTSETSDFMTEAQKAGEVKAYPRYRRDPTLDPQLVWQGKDEEDADDLHVHVAPIYVQEKVHPKALIENVRALSAEGMPMQMSLFDDFNGIAFEDAVDFYQHEQHWTNRLILGDSLAVMASLAEKEGLRGKVQMIYIDPPYGIKFNSNWQPSTLKTNVKDGKDTSFEPEQIQAFRDTWERGIHSYLSYLRDRLRIAYELLTDSGSIFVQIGNENVHRIRNLLDEVFGEENFCSLITYRTSVPLTSSGLPSVTDYIVWYAKDKSSYKYYDLFVPRETGEKSRYSNVKLPDGSRRALSAEEKLLPEILPEGSRIYADMDLASSGYTPSCIYSFTFNGKTYETSSGKSWKTTHNGMLRLTKAGRVSDSGSTIRYVLFQEDFPVTKLANTWVDTTGETDKRYVVQTHSKVIERCMLMTSDPGDLVLDPTCGSGTTAYVAEQWGRRWITIDTSRVALALARTRLMSAKFNSYQLKTDRVSDGFVYKTVPHITLKSIANNPQIDVIHEHYQPSLDSLRAAINAKLNKAFEEWELPRPLPPEERTSANAAVQELLDQWWALRRERQEAIDQAINDSAEMETLYDQPEERKKVVRVTGPFTDESLSPHRALDSSVRRGKRDAGAGQFLLDMLDQMREAGVTNTRKGEHITFTSLDLYPGKHIQAAGNYEQAGSTRRAAVLIGPQYGTVSWDMILSAAKEAAKEGVEPFDMLIACGFAFDPDVHSRKTQIGRLVVQTARINPELLLMGKDLRKTGALFTVFGEPDVQITRLKDGRIVVKLLGMDVYDPSRGEIRSSATAEVACWFIDTAYNDESFFVRHAYFTNRKTYDKLKSALNAEIDPEAWEALYRDESIPFDAPPKGKKIAVKVINHYGDEVMRVCEM